MNFSRISHTDNYSVRITACFFFARSKFPELCRQVGVWRGGGIFLCLHAFTLWQSTEKGITSSPLWLPSPTLSPNRLVYSGSSDPDKDRAFQQFSKQETQTHSHTSLQSNSSAPSVTSEKTLTLTNHQRPYYHQVIWLLTMGWLISARRITHGTTNEASPFPKSSIFHDVTQDCVKTQKEIHDSLVWGN